MKLHEAVKIIPKTETEYIIKNTDTGKYIKAGRKETAFLASFDQEDKFPGVVDLEYVKELDDKSKDALTKFYLQSAFLDNGEIIQEKKNIFHNLSNIKIFKINPDSFLERSKPYYDFIFSMPFFIVCLLILGIGGFMLFQNPELVTSVHLEMSASEIGILLPVTFLIIVIHECLHAMACKHYGCDVDRMGLLLFYFIPTFYVDVSDIYTLKSRKERSVVCLVGVFWHFVIANICLITWILLEKNGHSVRPLFFLYLINLTFGIYNLFPFVKMDGYWFLQSVLNVDNLMEKSRTFLMGSIINFGKKRIDIPNKQKALYGIFGFISFFMEIAFWFYGVELFYSLVSRITDIRLIQYLVVIIIIGGILYSMISKFIKTLQYVKNNRFFRYESKDAL